MAGGDENALTCQTLAATGNVEISLRDACNNFWTINSCPPFYISVQSIATSESSTAVCTGKDISFVVHSLLFMLISSRLLLMYGEIVTY